MRRILFALTLCLLGCDDEREEPLEPEYAGPLTFAPMPQCPAPNTPQAVHYQESGGAENALLWYMTMHALSGPSYHREVVHHHHYTSRPYVRPKVYPVYRPSYNPPRLKTTRTVPAIPSAALKPAENKARAPAWTAKPSKSFGYSAPASKPASTGFRPSSSKSSTSSFRSSSPSRSSTRPRR